MEQTVAQALATARFIDTCPDPAPAGNFAEVLRLRARLQPDDLAYCFLNFQREPDLVRSYRQVDHAANAIARGLIDRGLRGRAVVLAYPSAREFIEAFFGCLYAGCVAVPALPPDDEREGKRLIGILRDCEPGLVLTTGREIAPLRACLAARGLATLPCLATDELAATSADPVALAGHDPASLAFLQYTSGSTAEPKGVMVSHANLIHNEEIIAANLCSRTIRWLGLSWLPHYHDMGLIGGILHSIHIGRPVILYATTDFLQHPIRWLKLMSEFGASMTGAPNFAYDLCVKRSKRFDIGQLDLSRWLIAFNGAEPVRDETMTRFVERFAPSGLSPTTITPGYGLAEATLIVASRRLGEPLARLPADYRSLVAGRYAPARADAPSVNLLGNGKVGREADQHIRIIDPDLGQVCETGRIGEICVSGPSVCGGYLGKPALSAEIFAAYPEIGGERGHLRTGDLGFVDGAGELYVTGRLKDVVICNGANHYPQDIELVITEVAPQVRDGRVAVFNLNTDAGIAVLAVAEAASATPETLGAMSAAIRDAVAVRAGIPLAGVVFIAKGSMPRTSSGKIRRAECRTRYLDHRFDLAHAWYAPNWQAAIERLLDRREGAAAMLVV